MKRDNILIVISSIFLIIAIIIWQELFVFAKTTINFPIWAKGPPYPMMGAHLIALIALAPVVLLSKPGISIIKNTTITLLASTSIAIIVLVISNDALLTINRFTNDFIWVTLINCLPPAILLLLIRVIADVFIGKKANKAFNSDAKKDSRPLT